MILLAVTPCGQSTVRSADVAHTSTVDGMRWARNADDDAVAVVPADSHSGLHRRWG
ncbi:hypothetical protein HSR122_0327 [Halapricum desulfuricans]|uniref:Uncharacterized protein n=1 Tax=Halapricum desulfuricans TaxID=2841257 RepID=A0A897N628_9EURY|nr:hypothetical protein HSR122_0327 [Halapricum desulfuricans]